MEQLHALDVAVEYSVPDLWNTLGFFVGLTIVLWFLLRFIDRRKMAQRAPGVKMGRDPRLAAWLITDRFEDAVADGELSRKDANYWYNFLGHKCSMPDLLPSTTTFGKKMHPHRMTLLKKAIEWRLHRWFHTKPILKDGKVARKTADLTSRKVYNGKDPDKNPLVIPGPVPTPITKEERKRDFHNFFDKKAA